VQRREFLKRAGLFCLGLTALRAHAQTTPPSHPNIILILADDLGIGDLGCYGQKLIKTPNIDQLAREGTRYTNFYSGSAVCAPTRCSMLTGLHTGHCTRRDNRSANEPNPLVPLRVEDYTIAQFLTKAGYSTAFFGKWGLGNEGTSGIPEKHGFTEYLGYLDQVHAHNYYTDYLYKNGKKITIPENADKQRKIYSADLFLKETLTYLKTHTKDPFFLYLPYTLPHASFDPPSQKPYESMPWSNQDKNYAAMVTRLDDAVGQIMQSLRQNGLDKNTLVLFTSDNGPLERWNRTFNSSAGQPFVKTSLHEGGIKAPMIAWWPGKTPAGKVDDTLWWQVDFFATFAAVAGLTPPPRLDSCNMLALLLGNQAKPHDYLYWEIYAEFQQAARMGQWKGLRTGLEEPVQLYDLQADPTEQHNVAQENPDIVKKMQEIMQQAHVPSPQYRAVAHPVQRKVPGSRPGGGAQMQEIMPAD